MVAGKFRHWLSCGVLGLGLLLGSQALGYPQADAVRTFSGPGNILWSVMPDSSDSALFYRLPDYFAIAKSADGQNQISRRTAPNGDLILTFHWKVRDWIQENDGLREAILRETGVAPRVMSLFPRVQEIKLDPQLTEDFGAKVEDAFESPDLVGGSGWVSRVTVPQQSVRRFVRRVVEGAGFTHLISMQLRLPDDIFSEGHTTYPYSVGMFFGGLRYCDVIPNVFCTPANGGR